MKTRKVRKQTGFTLAELLIVVAIIAVLVAIGIAVYNKNMEKSREAYDVHLMRQAASLAVDKYYAGIYDQASAEAAGLRWWRNNGGDQDNAAGVYDPATGKFIPKQSKEMKEAHGKGTKVNTGRTYTYQGERDIYRSDLDYSKAVVMVAIYPKGNPHIDVYWKNINDGKYVGGDQGANNPKYSIRINAN